MKNKLPAIYGLCILSVVAPLRVQADIVSNTLFVDPAASPGSGARGTTNAYATLGAAVSDALSGDIIVIRPGTYALPLADITINVPLTIQGAGAVFQPAATATSSARIVCNAAVKFRDLTFEGPTVLVPSVAALINFTPCEGASMEGCVFRNLSQTCVSASGVKRFRLKSCDFLNSGTALFMNSPDASHLLGDVEILSCTAQDMSACGFVIHSDHGDVGGATASILGQPNKARNLLIDGVTCTNIVGNAALGFGVEVQHGWDNVKVCNSSFTNCSMGVSFSGISNASSVNNHYRTASNKGHWNIGLEFAGIWSMKSIGDRFDDRQPDGSAPAYPCTHISATGDNSSIFPDAVLVSSHFVSTGATCLHFYAAQGINIVNSEFYGKSNASVNSNMITIQAPVGAGTGYNIRDCVFAPVPGQTGRANNFVTFDATDGNFSQMLFSGNQLRGGANYSGIGLYSPNGHSFIDFSILNNQVDGVSIPGGYLQAGGTPILTRLVKQGNQSPNPLNNNAAFINDPLFTYGTIAGQVTSGAPSASAPTVAPDGSAAGTRTEYTMWGEDNYSRGARARMELYGSSQPGWAVDLLHDAWINNALRIDETGLWFKNNGHTFKLTGDADHCYVSIDGGTPKQMDNP